MDNRISINKIIADIKATKGNRSGCQGLSSSLESDGYITSICKWARATSPGRIDALLEHVEKQDAALIAWEKTMMEVCGEDGPASVAAEIRNLRSLRDTALTALRDQVKQLTAENVGLKAGRKFFMYSDDAGFETYPTREEAIKAAEEMIDDYRGDAGDGWPEEAGTTRWGVIIQQATECDYEKPSVENGWLGSCDYRLLPETTATSAYLAGIKADGVEWIEGNEPSEFGRYWVRYETDTGPQYCSAQWMEYNFCVSSNTNIHKFWLADHSRSINSLHGVTHYTKLPAALEGGAL
ncbi:hypothetical protein [Klebsiella michiganensis]|uniref:hypothetical protein n=1 Tax=Klebsiella michiganensis TaxID=1134687 RepID=UPI0008072D76|nr:hypothetical protein [Klebsiella michiganensis]DAF66439.1 MAG TPA: hypothetical protein [Caudoviricetes sp.]